MVDEHDVKVHERLAKAETRLDAHDREVKGLKTEIANQRKMVWGALLGVGTWLFNQFAKFQGW